MDPTLHTLLTTGLIAVSFNVVKHFGRKETVTDFISTLLNVFKADSLEITEDCELFVTDSNGTQRKVT